MRLWHYKLVPLLPRSQLIAQWRELNSIFRKQDRHILINYVYEYPKSDLLLYSLIVMREMSKRNITIRSFDNMIAYFYGSDLCRINAHPLIIEYLGESNVPFARHHDDKYLKVCYYNLYEKWMRGQKDFSDERMEYITSWMETQKEEL